ncbi:hypothetical protein POM88_001759 [Heracleum sosnowskyi]|uniref:Uncharacterized protein n=1 Tax=Heracleum sosnowskyi TaxID=360622 RepID=A0AAD8N9X6_9APIA|nr:hypothetical protein POM88_001759 [Heracleum sosnowskyi]
MVPVCVTVQSGSEQGARSVVGFFEADLLSKRFEDEGTNRDAWDHHKARWFLSGGRLLLYGYMAEKWWAVQSLLGFVCMSGSRLISFLNCVTGVSYKVLVSREFSSFSIDS